MRSTYNAQSEPERLIGSKPAEILSKNGKTVNVKLGFDKGKSKQLEEAEELLRASALAAASSIEATRERMRST